MLKIVEVRAAGGQREILVDDCSRQQILRILEWQSCVEHEPNFDDLVIHLARRTDLSKSSVEELQLLDTQPQPRAIPCKHRT